ncbi:hypothetical protein HW571_26470 [Agrobacterium genomosp. 3]|uniref:hypothetical protein n=1 Tax=Agrobacterium TaxID=357 RepID=UPI000DBFE828|nr:hypothetical protein [Agrobacterium sp. MS2]MCA1869175.1 hypothetical protein [Agrobacterium tomkonis]MCA1879532.1 hypothetical protein [Agrobacterium tumefaciens]MCA1894750.1 hypothetical protein [Agrobacterium tomkonis]RAL96584.1 hypothetical protein DOU54_16995 [Agrobacterium sp. MS2]
MPAGTRFADYANVHHYLHHPSVPEPADHKAWNAADPTGATIGGTVDERIHGLNLVNLYLSQFARGYSYTSVYILRDRTDEHGNQTFGFFWPDYSPRLAAHYLHNLNRILADPACRQSPGQLDYEIGRKQETVHDLLLQHSDGTFHLVIWGEALAGSSCVQVRLADRVRRVDLPVTGYRTKFR